MPKYHIYIREDVDQLLQKEAKRHGVTPKDIVRMRVETMSASMRADAIFGEIERLNAVVQGLFKLVAGIAPEIGFTSMANRLALANNEAHLRSADKAAKQVIDYADGIKKSFSEDPKGS